MEYTLKEGMTGYAHIPQFAVAFLAHLLTLLLRGRIVECEEIEMIGTLID